MILLDITELVQNPINTGIQRVVRALIRHWPSDIPLTLVTLDPARGMLQLPDAARAILLNPTATMDSAALGPSATLALNAASRILVPEVFYDAARCRFYRALPPEQVGFVVYDLIPYLYPAQIGVRQTASFMPYLRLLRDATHLAFISERTRAEFAGRIRRTDECPGPVLPLGADGLGLERQIFTTSRNDFVCIGSIDGRKNQALIIAAFQRLWQRGSHARLILVGSAFPRVDLSALEAIADHPHFTWHRDATDEALRSLLRGARATLYMSEIEGYGLPPLESLGAGIPVIVSDQVPSIRSLPQAGHIRLTLLNPATIEAAVEAVCDDQIAQDLWTQAASLALPGWADFAQKTAGWFSERQTQ